MLKSAKDGRFVGDAELQRSPNEVYETTDSVGSWITVFVKKIDSLDDAIMLLDMVNGMPKFWRRKRVLSELKKRISELEKWEKE